MRRSPYHYRVQHDPFKRFERWVITFVVIADLACMAVLVYALYVRS